MDPTPGRRAPLDAAFVGATHRTESARALLHSAEFRKAEELLHQIQEQSAEERRKKQVTTSGVKQSIYLAFIHRELSNEVACLELPITIFMSLAFATFALLLLRQEQILAVEDALKFDIGESAAFGFAGNFGSSKFQDIVAIADFWSWVQLGFLPLITQPSWPYSESYPAALGTPAYDGTAYGAEYGNIHGQPFWLFDGYERPAPLKNDYLHYTRLVGGIRFQQTLAQASFASCVVPAGLDRGLMMEWLGKPCEPNDGGILTPEIQDVETFDDMARVEWLYPELDDFQELIRTVVDMEDGCSHAAAVGNLESCRCTSCRSTDPRQPYVNEQTSRLEVAFVAYNPQYGIYSYIGANLFFNRGGHIHKIINSMSVWANFLVMPQAQFAVMITAGILWMLMLARILVGEAGAVVSVVRNSKLRCWQALYKEYIGFWNLVEWTSLIFGIVLLGVFMQTKTRIDATNASLELMMGASDRARLGATSREEYKRLVDRFFEGVQNTVQWEMKFRKLFVFYPLILMMRLFKSFAAQARLAIITKTLARASEDLIHFGIVFLSVFFAFTLNSVLLFGKDMEDFSTLPRAINGCFRAMFGDWDWESMQQVGLFRAQIWFWLFLSLMVLILLNILLAVIMGAYAEEKGRAQAAESLAAQAHDMYRRFRQYRRGERVHLNDIWSVFHQEYHGDITAMLAEDRLLTASWLTDRVPHLQEEQAKRTLENSLIASEHAFEAEITEESRLKYISDQVDKCEGRLQAMLEELQYMTSSAQYYDRLQAHGDFEYDLHFGRDDVLEAQASQEPGRAAVTGYSQGICNWFVDHLDQIEAWQDSFEQQQNELHGLVTGMQTMVTQQARCIAAMSEAVAQLGHDGDSIGVSSVALGE